MSLVVSTELQQIAVDLVEKIVEDKSVKYIRLKDEFKNQTINESTTKLIKQQHQQINSIIKDKKPAKIFNPKRDLQNFIAMENKTYEFGQVRVNSNLFTERF